MMKALTAFTLVYLAMATTAVAIDKPASSTFRLKKARIVGEAPREADDLQRLSNQVLKLESDVDTLQTSVQMNKQHIIESSKINHALDVSLEFEGMEQINVRLLDVRLDGFPLFSVNETTGLWTQRNTVPVYAGPIMPGDHEAIIVAKFFYAPNESDSLSDKALSHIEEKIPFSIALDQKVQHITLKMKLDKDVVKIEQQLDPVTIKAEQSHE